MTVQHHNTRDRLTDVLNTWLPMWNGDIDLAADLVHDDFQVWFGTSPGAGDSVRGPDAFHEFLATYRLELPDATFTPGAIVVDEVAGGAAMVWSVSVTLPGEDVVSERGGLDHFVFVDGRIREVWSITGAEPRPF
jgi:ketosteroid isomerase-like protein